jgi:hypothetical protein
MGEHGDSRDQVAEWYDETTPDVGQEPRSGNRPFTSLKDLLKDKKLKGMVSHLDRLLPKSRFSYNPTRHPPAFQSGDDLLFVTMWKIYPPFLAIDCF